MEEKIQQLSYKTKVNDLDDEKGIVTIGVNGIGIEDAQGDISMPGSFTKTLQEGLKQRIKHLLDHDYHKQIGVPVDGYETDRDLVFVSALNLEKQISRDVYSDYKFNAEHGRTMEHSIGVSAVKRDNADSRKVLEWKLFEYSTLNAWGANPRTGLIDLKTATQDDVRRSVEVVREAMKERYSDERLKNLDMELSLLLKSLNGDLIVTCPECGQTFDYNEQHEHTFSDQVLEYAARVQGWIMQGIIDEEMSKLKPEIREQVLAILDTFKLGRMEMTEKSIVEIASYVRCPHCWSRVYKTQAIGKEEEPAVKTEEPLEGTLQDDVQCDATKQDEAADSTSCFWEGISDMLNK